MNLYFDQIKKENDTKLNINPNMAIKKFIIIKTNEK
jgi:hypothetical protein